MPAPKIIAPQLRVVLEHGDQLEQIDVQTDNRDAVRFDLLRERKGWPKMADGPMLWATTLAWNALRRSKHPAITDNVEKDLDKFVSVEILDDDGQPKDVDDVTEEDVTAGPTNPAP